MTASWAGEDSCIRLYGFYAYSPSWAAFLDRVPLAIVCISVVIFLANAASASSWALATAAAPPNRVGSLGAIQNFGGFLGAAVAPIVTGVILEATGGRFGWVFVVGGLLLVVGALSYGFGVKARRVHA